MECVCACECESGTYCLHLAAQRAMADCKGKPPVSCDAAVSLINAEDTGAVSAVVPLPVK